MVLKYTDDKARVALVAAACRVYKYLGAVKIIFSPIQTCIMDDIIVDTKWWLLTRWLPQFNVRTIH